MGEEPLENPWEKSNLNHTYMGYASNLTSLRCAILQPYSFCWGSAVSVIHDLFRLWTQPLVGSDSSAMRFGRGKFPFWGGCTRINGQKQVGSECSDECWFLNRWRGKCTGIAGGQSLQLECHCACEALRKWRDQSDATCAAPSHSKRTWNILEAHWIYFVYLCLSNVFTTGGSPVV